MTIQSEPATFYRANGRRYFTKRAAARAEARATIFRKHPCDCDKDDPEVGYKGYTCHLHAMEPNRYDKLIRRMARLHLAEFNNKNNLALT